MAEVLKYSL